MRYTKIKNSLFISVLITVVGFSASTHAYAEAEMWRENAPEVKRGSLGSVIEDSKYLNKALPASAGYYLFSEKGAGVKPLVLIGTPAEILTFLAKRQNSGIENQIKDLPDIYMNMMSYTPGKRFKGLFPVQDFMQQFIENTAKFIPASVPIAEGIGHTLNDTTGTFSDFVEYLQTIKGKHSKNAQKAPKKIYLRFSYHYLEGVGMEKIGTRTVSFKDLLRRFYLDLKPLPALPGK